MNDTNTLEQFYAENFPPEMAQRFLFSPQLGHFNVFPRGEFCKQLTHFNRRDYYKISVIDGAGLIHHAEKTMEVRGRALVFYNPAVPYTWEAVSEKQGGYFCLFNNKFIAPSLSDKNLNKSALFNTNLNCVFNLTDEQAEHILYLFRQMSMEVESDYIEKYDLIRHYLHLIFHEARKLQPANLVTEKYINASVRISSLFIEMLERQFPVDSTEHALKLKSPHDFAEKLSVHVNHLNRAVKDATGRSTTELISARVANEAKSLLKYTDNSVSDIAYSLGFEHPSNFNNFFKKHTGYTPKYARMISAADPNVSNMPIV